MLTQIELLLVSPQCRVVVPNEDRHSHPVRDLLNDRVRSIILPSRPPRASPAASISANSHLPVGMDQGNRHRCRFPRTCEMTSATVRSATRADRGRVSEAGRANQHL